ncbi:2Fe-2S iron-sulfur cluster-binding protein [Haloarcula salinisoli]|uniref:2Fe-2S iron-sulfur cluster binding domain-containing protein n=1 Tax=Haloarcula salinisoli TaxID=2487746 RepID=A0A8J7YE73_9EURY|nr:2Fe-2S iron-sulfur cluster-binding protein [Halomicroarcula salinisoli]MBX0287152.1 2Fe-2S iron-sulfur cluster binding domain-containing protein [Halomicroarcula salinisoli]MBX0304455.1 2Fe-2S iron-sulfur cluster binding domain-containing protein [Halomicroarcula salinisoli]
MVSFVGVLSGLTLTLIVVALHYAKGTGWEAPEDISQEVLEQRAATVPETDFPEPYNRGIGGGSAAAIPAGEAEGELGESEEEEEEAGFDPDAIADDEVEYYEIEFAKEGETIEVANNENLLEAGEEEGWDLPYACREGQCISCAGQITDGPAEEYIRHSQNDSLMDDDMEEGYCLTCVAYPTEEFTLETSESP